MSDKSTTRKLCKYFFQSGRCLNPNCTYAHSLAALQANPGQGPTAGDAASLPSQPPAQPSALQAGDARMGGNVGRNPFEVNQQQMPAQPAHQPQQAQQALAAVAGALGGGAGAAGTAMLPHVESLEGTWCLVIPIHSFASNPQLMPLLNMLLPDTAEPAPPQPQPQLGGRMYGQPATGLAPSGLRAQANPYVGVGRPQPMPQMGAPRGANPKGKRSQPLGSGPPNAHPGALRNPAGPGGQGRFGAGPQPSAEALAAQLAQLQVAGTMPQGSFPFAQSFPSGQPSLPQGFQAPRGMPQYASPEGAAEDQGVSNQLPAEHVVDEGEFYTLQQQLWNLTAMNAEA